MFQVLPNGSFGKVEPVRDLQVCVPGGDQPEQLLLPRGQLHGGAVALQQEIVQEDQVWAQLVVSGLASEQDHDLAVGALRSAAAPSQDHR